MLSCHIAFKYSSFERLNKKARVIPIEVHHSLQCNKYLKDAIANRKTKNRIETRCRMCTAERGTLLQ